VLEKSRGFNSHIPRHFPLAILLQALFVHGKVSLFEVVYGAFLRLLLGKRLFLLFTGLKMQVVVIPQPKQLPQTTPTTKYNSNRKRIEVVVYSN
jgi:hypothetical protein